METMPSFEEMKKYGYDFGALAMDWITTENKNQLAMDAGLITSANSAVPVELSTYFDPMVSDILTGARKASEI